jgi:hypothetical protein
MRIGPFLIPSLRGRQTEDRTANRKHPRFNLPGVAGKVSSVSRARVSAYGSRGPSFHARTHASLRPHLSGLAVTLGLHVRMLHRLIRDKWGTVFRVSRLCAANISDNLSADVGAVEASPFLRPQPSVSWPAGVRAMTIEDDHASTAIRAITPPANNGDVRCG